MDSPVHIPVLLDEVVEILRPGRGGWFVDATLGLGGHAQALLEASDATRVLGIDMDPEALRLARDRLDRFGDRLVTVEGRYEDLAEHLSRFGLPRVEGVLLDLGVSSLQLDRPERGFSFSREGPLDMRMSLKGPTAGELLATLSVGELSRIFRSYGEESRAGGIARAIGRARERAPITTTAELRQLVTRAVGGRRQARTDPATRVFQALRIATNRELVDLERFLDDAIERLSLGSRLAVLAYHSLEDRIVKTAFRRHTAGCTCPPSFPVCVCSRRRVISLVTKKPIRPSLAEIRENPRSRSARLRVVERLGEGRGTSGASPPSR